MGIIVTKISLYSGTQRRWEFPAESKLVEKAELDRQSGSESRKELARRLCAWLKEARDLGERERVYRLSDAAFLLKRVLGTGRILGKYTHYRIDLS